MRQSLILAVLLAACSPDHKTADDTAGTSASAVEPDPALVVVEPAAASWHAAEPIAVSGYVQDAAGVALGGSALPLDADQSFSGTAELARGVNVIEVTAEGADGLPLVERLGVIAGEYADPAEPIPDGLQVRMNRAGLDTFGDFGETLITAETLQKELASINPIYSAEPIVGTQINADVTGVAFGQPEIILTPTPGALEIQASIPDLVIDMDAYGEIAWIGFEDTAQISAERAVLDAELVIGVGEDGQLTAELLDPVVTLSGFGYDIAFLWDELEGLFVETVRTTIEDLLVEQMAEMVPALLQETLAALDLSFSTELLGTALTASASFASADVDANGVEIGLGLAVSIDGDGDKSYLGYLAAGAPAPAADTVAPMAMMLSDDLLNRTLLNAWRGGVADVTLSTEDGTLDPSIFDGFPVDTAVISTRLDLPPVIVESGGLLELQVAELQLTADTPGASIGDHMVATVDVTAQLALAVRGSTLGVELGDVSLGLSIVESDWSVSEDGLKTLIGSLVSPSALQEILDGFALELPELYGLTIAHAAVERAETGYHTAVSIEVAVADDKTQEQ